MNAIDLSIPPDLVPVFAPTGTLRAAINVGNPILANRGPDGQPVGVSVDLAHAFARLLGTGIEMSVFDGAPGSVDVVTREVADIGFFAIDPVRGAGISFTAPYVIIEGAYVVRQDSPVQANEDVDVPGRTISVADGSAYDLFLRRELKQATLVRTATSREVLDAFVAGKLDVAAGVKQALLRDMQRHPGLRMLPGHFMLIRQAMGLPKGRPPQALAFLKRFVETAKASGFVTDSLQRHRIEGAALAPAED